MQGDLAAGYLIDNVAGVDLERRARLMRLLDINPKWRMHQVSDGQRRRVQVCMGLLKPYDLLLLDEVRLPVRRQERSADRVEPMPGSRH
jgi:CCR4-NOT complex subunit CAF16